MRQSRERKGGMEHYFATTTKVVNLKLQRMTCAYFLAVVAAAAGFAPRLPCLACVVVGAPFLALAAACSVSAALSARRFAALVVILGICECVWIGCPLRQQLLNSGQENGEARVKAGRKGDLHQEKGNTQYLARRQRGFALQPAIQEWKRGKRSELVFVGMHWHC
ncbi:hypothetical protein GQ54DRAFT_217520 [Martensiomyces pterosporus]|nr:hypothetical protein GQ54DRAFT_217520 [Martensiomyces pterosporus]